MKPRPYSRSFGAILALTTTMQAQTSVIHVRLRDGRTGVAVAGRLVNLVTVPPPQLKLWKAHVDGELYSATVDQNVSLLLGSVQATEQDFNQWLPCAKGGVQHEPTFSVDKIMNEGVVSPNTCNKKITSDAEPGTLIVFIRPLTFWEKIVGFFQE